LPTVAPAALAPAATASLSRFSDEDEGHCIESAAGVDELRAAAERQFEPGAVRQRGGQEGI